jgi:hypothetical protein
LWDLIQRLPGVFSEAPVQYHRGLCIPTNADSVQPKQPEPLQCASPFHGMVRSKGFVRVQLATPTHQEGEQAKEEDKVGLETETQEHVLYWSHVGRRLQLLPLPARSAGSLVTEIVFIGVQVCVCVCAEFVRAFSSLHLHTLPPTNLSYASHSYRISSWSHTFSISISIQSGSLFNLYKSRDASDP